MTRRLATAVLALAAILGIAGCSSDAGPDPSPVTTSGHSATTTTTAEAPRTSREAVRGWERVDDWPLESRTRMTIAWTGEELLVVGGVLDTCPPNADCAAAGPPFADGAALDLETGTWREIAPAPVAFGWASTAVVDGDVYAWIANPDTLEPDAVTEPVAFVRYDAEADEWTELPIPELETRWFRLTAAGDEVLASPSSDEGGSEPTWRFDPATERWSELPDDPLPRLFDRRVVADGGFAYLFGHELVPNPGADGPSLVVAARFDLEAGTWEELPTSSSLSTELSAAGDGILVNPSLGSADGGEVGNWGRPYPEGAVFATGDLTWHDLPAAPDDAESWDGIGFLGTEFTEITGTGGGYLLDTATDEWVAMGAPPGGSNATRTLGSADRAAVAVGGTDWSDGTPRPLDDVWIWRAPS